MKNLALTAMGAVLVLGACSRSDTYEANVDEAVSPLKMRLPTWVLDRTARATVDFASLRKRCKVTTQRSRLASWHRRKDRAKGERLRQALVEDHGSHKQELKTLAQRRVCR